MSMVDVLGPPIDMGTQIDFIYLKKRQILPQCCRMMHIKEPLLLSGKSSLCVSSGYPLSLSEWSFTIYLMPYNRK